MLTQMIVLVMNVSMATAKTGMEHILVNVSLDIEGAFVKRRLMSAPQIHVSMQWSALT